MALNINEQSLISNFVNLGISLNAKNNAMIVEIEEKITIENPIGHPSRREEAIPLLKDKFLRNTESLFDKEKATYVWDKIINLEKDDDLNKFFNILNEDE